MTLHAAVALLALTLVALIAILVGIAAGYLARRDNASWPAALTRAAAATGGTAALAAAVSQALASLPG